MCDLLSKSTPYHTNKKPRYWAGLNGYILFTTAVTITIAVADY